MLPCKDLFTVSDDATSGSSNKSSIRLSDLRKREWAREKVGKNRWRFTLWAVAVGKYQMSTSSCRCVWRWGRLLLLLLLVASQKLPEVAFQPVPILSGIPTSPATIGISNHLTSQKSPKAEKNFLGNYIGGEICSICVRGVVGETYLVFHRIRRLREKITIHSRSCWQVNRRRKFRPVTYGCQK